MKKIICSPLILGKWRGRKVRIYQCILVVIFSLILPKFSFALELAWSNSGPIPSMHCTAVNEELDPHTWSDNFLCSSRDIGLSFINNAQFPPGKKCISVNEPADPNAWGDNYLCWSDPSVNLDFFNYYDRNILESRKCTQIHEPADPHTWNDNYICFPKQPSCEVLNPECPTCSTSPSTSDLTRFNAQEVVYRGASLKSSMGVVEGDDLVYVGEAKEGWLLYGPYSNNLGSEVRIYGSVVISTAWAPDAYETCSYRDIFKKCRGWDLHHHDAGFTVDYALGPNALSLGAVQKININDANRMTINLPGLKCDGPVTGIEVRIRGLFGGLTRFVVHESRITTLWKK